MSKVFDLLKAQKSLIAFTCAALAGYAIFSGSEDSPSRQSVVSTQVSPVENSINPQIRIEPIDVGREDGAADSETYSWAEAGYLESLKDQEVAQGLEYSADEEALTEAQVVALEAQRKIERRKELIIELNDGEEPEITDAEREIISQLLHDEGLSSVYDEEL